MILPATGATSFTPNGCGDHRKSPSISAGLIRATVFGSMLSPPALCQN
jgi:hypothetical protein